MVGASFSPRLEVLNDRLCLSATAGEVMWVDPFKPGEEVGAVVDYRVGEAGWDVKPGEEQGAAVDYKTGDMGGWDKPGAAQGAAVDFGLLVPAVRIEDAKAEDRTIIAISGWDKPGEEQGAAVDYLKTGDLGGWDKPAAAQGAAVDGQGEDRGIWFENSGGEKDAATVTFGGSYVG